MCGTRRLLIIEVRSHVSNVRIGQADNLARIARIGEDFLISGEAGIENDFAAAPGDRSRGAALKNSPVFERKNPCRASASVSGSSFRRVLRFRDK